MQSLEIGRRPSMFWLHAVHMAVSAKERPVRHTVIELHTLLLLAVGDVAMYWLALQPVNNWHARSLVNVGTLDWNCVRVSHAGLRAVHVVCEVGVKGATWYSLSWAQGCTKLHLRSETAVGGSTSNSTYSMVQRLYSQASMIVSHCAVLPALQVSQCSWLYWF